MKFCKSITYHHNTKTTCFAFEEMMVCDPL
ncbi:hypothetical protein SAMN05216463_115101 [Xylanibacter ruminicola]|uniref:Uncharacterized protein n=1 Tax=Xylanibacter ruminicola TaxID=839 RepID=A0A1M6W8E9_XYLRU|nr:hypothetical protein SAMN05216463_115101 [Xylanibacter ruminicola]